MKLRPIGERVILQPLEQKERTASGIYLPKSDDKKEGEVVEVGTLKNGSIIPLMKGDRVIFGGYSSEEYDVDGKKVIIVDYKDVLAKIEKTQQDQSSEPNHYTQHSQSSHNSSQSNSNAYNSGGLI